MSTDHDHLASHGGDAVCHLQATGRASGRPRTIEGEPAEPLARRMLAAKYQGWREGQPLSPWAAGSLPVEIELATGPNRAGGQ